MRKLREFLKRITGVSTPIGGISWSPPPAEEGRNPSSAAKLDGAGSSFSDGDWITAGIVGPERAVSALQRVATSVTFRTNASRQKRIEEIESAVAAELLNLRARYEAGGETDEDRCEACIAKIVADIIGREMTSYRWKLDRKADADPLDTFNEVIRNLMKKDTG